MASSHSSRSGIVAGGHPQAPAARPGGPPPWPAPGHRYRPTVAAATPPTGPRSRWWPSAGQRRAVIPGASGATAAPSRLPPAVPAPRTTSLSTSSASPAVAPRWRAVCNRSCTNCGSSAILSSSVYDTALTYDRVPPTVRPLMRIVGKPTPTGTDWPFLPHVPTPVSRARSLPTMVMRVRTSGPLPMRLAPLTGRVSLPCSMR